MAFKTAPYIKKEFSKVAAEAKTTPGSEGVVALLKKSGDVEKAAAAWDKAILSKDSELIRDAFAKLESTGKLFSGKSAAENVKLGKSRKEGSGDAAALAGTLTGVLHMVLQSASEDFKSGMAELKNAEAAKEMPVTSFYGDWVSAKKMFEALTGKQKPTKTFLTAFRASTGLESATKALDAAAKANSVSAFEKALKDFDKVGKAYFVTVKKQANISVSEDDTDIPDESEEGFKYDEALTILLKTLNVIRKEASDILKKAKA